MSLSESTYDDLVPGTAIDRYVVEKVLGRGGMAVVYRVRHEELGTRHALKVLGLPLRSVQRRLRQEGRVQAALRHRNIVNVTDIIDVDGSPGLVMEYVDGPSLDELLKGTKLTLEQADALGRGILTGVGFVHEHGLVHRDLKPANILVAIEGEELVPKVADFGLAKILRPGEGDKSHTRSGSQFGTPAYMAPEQIRDTKQVDTRADIFSLGAVLYELVTGEQCFERTDVLEVYQSICNGDWVPVSDKVKVPRRIEDAIAGALTVEVDQRIPDCETLLSVWIGETIPDDTPWDSSIVKKVSMLGSGADTLGDPTITSPSSSNTFQLTMQTTSTTDLTGPDWSTEVAAPPQQSWFRTVAALGLGVMLGGGVLGLVGLGGGLLLSGYLDPSEPVQAPVVAPRPLPPPVKPAPVAQQPPATPAPKKKASRPRPRPQPRVQAAQAPPPKPADPPPTPAQPEPEPEPAPVGPPPRKGRVFVVGDAERVLLQNASGSYDAGIVPPGTYRVRVFFDSTGEPKDTGTITVRAGETVQLECVKMLRVCR